jgi:transcriptional regulator with XRE-family HTH domain
MAVKKTSKRATATDTHIGQRIRSRRLMLKMSQMELADVLGLTFQQVQKYEKGVNRVGGSRLQQLSAALKVPVMFFFEGAPPPSIGRTNGHTEQTSSNEVNAFLATKDGLAICTAFTKIDRRTRTLVRDLIERIAEQGDR